MKNLITIIFLLIGSILSGQEIIYNGKFPTSTPYAVSIWYGDTAIFTPEYKVWHQVTNDTKNLWPMTYYRGFDEHNDTVVADCNGLFFIQYTANVESKENKVWAYRICQKRVENEDTVFYFEIKGGGVVGQRVIQAVANIKKGDKIWLEMTCVTSPTAEGSYYGGTMTIMEITKTSYVGVVHGYPVDAGFESVTTDDFFFEPPHTKMCFRDSAVTITAGTSVQITNDYDSLYRVLETENILYKLGDTIQILKKGGYNTLVSLRGYGSNTTDWSVKTARKRNGVTTDGEQEFSFTTTGSGNRNGGTFVFYNEYEVGDKIWLTLTRLSGTGNFTAISGNFNVQLFYRQQ